MKNNEAITYFINGIQTTQKEFDKKLEGLKGQVKWSCEKNSGGGVVFYWAQDAEDNWYRVELESGGRNKRQITLDKNFRA